MTSLIRDVIKEVGTQNVVQIITNNDPVCKTTWMFKELVFNMNDNGAPVLDGFNGSVYQSYWYIMGANVCNFVVWFFVQGLIISNLNSKETAIFPKFPHADRIENYHLIALANLQFNIFTKFLVDYLDGTTSKSDMFYKTGTVQLVQFIYYSCCYIASIYTCTLGKV
jgi:hypothetical protein